MFVAAASREKGFLYHVQEMMGHRNSTLGCLPFFLSSNAFFSATFSTPARWEDDPKEASSTLPLTRAIVFGSLKFGMTRSHWISTSSFWLNMYVSSQLLTSPLRKITKNP